MTVGELKELLSQFSDSNEVVFEVDFKEYDIRDIELYIATEFMPTRYIAKLKAK